MDIQSAKVEQQSLDSAPMKLMEVWEGLEELLEVIVCSNLIKCRLVLYGHREGQLLPAAVCATGSMGATPGQLDRVWQLGPVPLPLLDVMSMLYFLIQKISFMNF